MWQFLNENVVFIVLIGSYALYAYVTTLFDRNREEIDRIKALNIKLYDEERKKNKEQERRRKDSYKIDLTIKPHWLKIFKHYHSMLHDTDCQKKIYEECIERIEKKEGFATKTNQYSQNTDCPQFVYFNISFDGTRERIKFWNSTLSQFSEGTTQNFVFERRESGFEYRGSRNQKDELRDKLSKFNDKSGELYDEVIASSGLFVPVPVTTTIEVNQASIIVEEMPISFIPTAHVISEIIRHHRLNIPKGLFVLSFSKKLEKTLAKCGVKYSAHPFDSVYKVNKPNYHAGSYPDGSSVDNSRFDLTREECRLKVAEGEFKAYHIEDFIKEDEDSSSFINLDKYNDAEYKKTLKGMRLIDIGQDDFFSMSIERHILTHEFMTVEFSITFESEDQYSATGYEGDYDCYSVGSLIGIKNPQSIIDAYKKDKMEQKDELTGFNEEWERDVRRSK